MTSDAEKSFKAKLRAIAKEKNRDFWNEYLRGLRPEHISALPRNIADVIFKMNDWLRSHTRLI